MKKVLSAALALSLALVLLTPVEAKAAPELLRWEDTFTVSCSFVFSSGQYRATVTGYSGTTSVKATIVVYEMNGNTKTEVSRFTDTKTGSFGTIIGSYGGFVKGRTYYMEVTATVYRNGSSEVTNHTATQTY